MPSSDQETIKRKLQTRGFVFVASKDVPGQVGQVSMFFSCQTINGVTFVVELKLKAGINIGKVTVRSKFKTFSELCKAFIAKILTI